MNAARIRTVTSRLAIPTESGPRSATDAELLTRFIVSHDETAFEAIVSKHLPAVRAVCRSQLRDPNDADDAVQATFLVLVRRAEAVRDRLALGGWLCRVAWRTANKLREMNQTRTSRVAPIDPDTTPGRTTVPGDARDSFAAIHEEIALLPERYRTAVLTCYAAGVPTAQAAARLGWPKGTLLTRLAWARKRLRDRLTKRHVMLSGSFVALLADRLGVAAGAAMRSRVVASAVAVAAGDAAAARELVSDRVSSLTEGVVRNMIGTKIKIALGMAFLAVAILGLGLGRMSAGPVETVEKKNAPLASAPPATKSADSRVATSPATPAPEEPRAEAAAEPAAQPSDLIVRRPKGGYTREVPGLGSATLTFQDGRLFLDAAVRVEKMTFTIKADADYSMNRESMIYGIITSAELNGPLEDEDMAEIALIVNAATDMPFAFRVRVEDDGVTIKDIKFGPFGNPLFAEALGGGDSAKEMMLLTGYVTGKYKANVPAGRNAAPASERAAPPIVPRGATPNAPPRSKRGISTNAAIGALLNQSGGSTPGALVGGAIPLR